MLGAGNSWRLFFYVEAAFAAALWILAFIFVEESTYHRSRHLTQETSSSHSLAMDPTVEKGNHPTQLENVSSVSVPRRKSFLSTLKPWSAIDPEPEFFMTIARSFTYFLVPAVFWVISTYGRSYVKEFQLLWLISWFRAIYRPRGFGIQLYLPNQDHGAPIQLE